MDNQQPRHFLGRYFVSKEGYVYSELNHEPFRASQSTHNKYKFNGKWYMRLQVSYNNSKGYGRIKLPIGTFSIARLVAELFIPNPMQLPQVNHKDGDKKNNHADNLEWVSNRENLDHAMRNGLRKRIDYTFARDLLENTTMSQKEICNIVGCSRSTLEKFINKCKVQRPEHYKASDKMNETRGKLVGSKWNRKAGSAQSVR